VNVQVCNDVHATLDTGRLFNVFHKVFKRSHENGGMASPESATLLVLLTILTLGLVIPELLRKFHLPFISLIILAGAVFGPNGLRYAESNETINFIGFLGMAFLMLMAGLDTDLSKITKNVRKILLMAFLNGFVPFSVGFAIVWLFGYPLLTSLLVGIVFISSSVAVIVPSLKGSKLIPADVAQLILSAVIVADVVSLLALGLVFQNVERITVLPLWLYYLVLIISIPVIVNMVPRFANFLLSGRLSRDEGSERKLRFVIIIIIGTLAYFSILGVHPILAAFLAGLALSTVVRKDTTGLLYAKLHTLGYGMFVPVFFFIVGMEMDLLLLRDFDIGNVLMILLIFGLIIAKMVSGYAAGRIVHLGHRDSMLFGSVSIIQLTTTLAVTYAASSLGILDAQLTTSIILLSIITTLIGPILVSYISQKGAEGV
jgi:Kef-type K+ transport system membrane component KefB